MQLSPITVPYLPSGKVKVLAAGEGARVFSEDLAALGVSVLYTNPVPALPKVLCTHADLALCPLGDKRFCLDTSQSVLYTELQEMGLEPMYGTRQVKSGYPDDVAYNVLKIGTRFLLCNRKITDETVLSVAKRDNCTVLHCKQGYTKCSVSLVRENAAITDDIGIAKVLSENGFDVLRIEKGDILLEGLNYGFIGGCSVMLSAHEMLFLGDLRLHRNGDAIQAFLKNYGVTPICVQNIPLTDIGSLIPLLQEETNA